VIFFCLSATPVGHNALSILCEIGFTLRQVYQDVMKILNSEQFFSLLNLSLTFLVFYTAISLDLLDQVNNCNKHTVIITDSKQVK